MQAYRISGGILVLHGKEQTDLELTTDEKTAFQETMDEFVTDVSDMVDFNKLNVYSNNVEWSGKLIEFDVEFFFSIGEENGVYFNGEMLKADNEFLELISKLKTYYEKFKSKWASILASRKKTIKTEE
jgi:lipoate-protein ligase A